MKISNLKVAYRLKFNKNADLEFSKFDIYTKSKIGLMESFLLVPRTYLLGFKSISQKL